MVFKRMNMKKKRKGGFPSLLDENPKRTKVHAQRKFAQGSNVNSPVITPIKELENDSPKSDILSEPVELLPIKRPNTEDFLTFLCFRGTPILPPTLNFFNTASIVDTNGQVHEIKSEAPKNGPIDIAKCGTSSEKPFIAFGVRKRADPIVISRQMDRKRRHALAIQALRRKYQEQKMAKIRALTISKLSEKVINKTVVRTNSISKTENVTKKNSTLLKSKPVATKHFKVTTQTLKTTLRPTKIKQQMCLRSFRGRFVQKELPFKRRVATDRRVVKKDITKKVELKQGAFKIIKQGESLSMSTKETKARSVTPNVLKKSIKESSLGGSSRITRSGLSTKTLNVRRHRIKKRIILSASSNIVKPRLLRSTTVKKTVLSQRKSKTFEAKKEIKAQQNKQCTVDIKNNKHVKNDVTKQPQTISDIKKSVSSNKKDMKETELKVYKKQAENKKDNKKAASKKVIKQAENKNLASKMHLKKYVNVVAEIKNDVPKSTTSRKEISKTNESVIKQKIVEIKKDIGRSFGIKKVTHKKNLDYKKCVEKSLETRDTTASMNAREVLNTADLQKKNGKEDDNSFSFKKELSISIEKKKKETKKPGGSLKKLINKSGENKFNISLSGNTTKKVNEPIISNSIVALTLENSTHEKEILINLIPNAKHEEIIVREIPKTSCEKDEKSADTNFNKETTVFKNKKDVDVTEIKKDIDDKTDEIKTCKTSLTQEYINKDITDVSLEKYVIIKTTNSANKVKKNPKKPVEVILKEEEVDKTKNAEKPAESLSVPKILQRPSRKTKEAAAIYMEILSHKLVNDNKVDDDNVSIDSFPELPNVKKTEQRENELKAQAKSTKDETKVRLKTNECELVTSNMDVTTKESKDTNQICKNIKIKMDAAVEVFVDEIVIQENGSKKEQFSLNIIDLKEKEPNAVQLNKLRRKKIEVESDFKVSKNIDLKSKKESQNLSNSKVTSLGKKKSINEKKLAIDKDVKVNCKAKNVEKCDEIKNIDSKPPQRKATIAENVRDKDVSKMQSKIFPNACKNKETYDSDESFHIDIKVPRKKKCTRSKLQKVINSELFAEKKQDSANNTFLKNTKQVNHDSSDSDHSTTSDINLQMMAIKAKNKKNSKTKNLKQSEVEFSDSDEEPLSKLTNKSLEGSQRSAITKYSDKIKQKNQLDKRDLKIVETPKCVTKYKIIHPKVISKAEEIGTDKPETPKPTRECTDKPETPKPKRECTKKPQNYLPMLSSSDEDEIFHGFDKNNGDQITKPLPSIEPRCTHTPPLLDLLSKDIGRRFGKEKVNMSTEQIEKWLNESALASSSIKKENDEMLKFGEIIPTETSLEANELMDTQKLKCTLFETIEIKEDVTKDTSTLEISNTSQTKSEKVKLKLNNQAKPQVDRKLIFRKGKKEAVPNINAFSPENESSIYAFGEETEDIISTPFRRPSRRPSSTATSRSEDECTKHEEIKTGHFLKPTVKCEVSKGNKEECDANVETDECSHLFYIPQKPSKLTYSKLQPGILQKPKTGENKSVIKVMDRISDADDFKYKVPSSPSASSSSSAKIYKRQTQKQKLRLPENLSSIYMSDFPKKMDPAKLVEAPVFHPTDQDFQDPLEYIERIRHKAEQFGICRIVPPSSFKPECKVTDDMRFMAYNQYVHKMLHRWGPNFKELMAIKKYLDTQNITLNHPPWIGGMEIDLPRLYQTVQTLGGLKEVIEKKKWPRVSDMMKIPKSAQDRVTKLDDIYCKYLLPYDTLSPAEREKLFDEVETAWAKRESKGLIKDPQKINIAGGDSEPEDNEAEECITKGRNMALNSFYRIARNTMSMYFKTPDPTAQEVEQEYWKHATMKQNHICVHSGSIDSGNWGYGFATSKNSPFARHAWNLKILTNNSGSVLRSLGPLMGVTVPTLHVGMVFSSCCWYRDPHGLPWIEYLHTGGNKIWYGIPNCASDIFHSTLKKLVPNYCKDKELWLPSDTVMVPPSLLVENNVSLCRTVQDPGQFVVVFPKSFTSSISTGYVVSESVYFAPVYWLKTARGLFNALRKSSEPSMFSFDRLVLSIASDGRSSPDILRQIIPHIQEICDKEKEGRNKLKSFGIMEIERMPLPEVNNRKKKKKQTEEGDYECEICRMNLFVSMVFDKQEAITYCLDHAIEMIENKTSEINNCKFMFTYDDEELEGLLVKIRIAIDNKLQKKVPNKFAGMPTLLGK